MSSSSSYTRKVTVIKQGCNGERVVTVTTTSSGSGAAPGCVQKTSATPFWTKLTGSKPVSSQPASSKPANNQPTSPVKAEAFESAVLEEHNRLRAKHSAGPLRLDPAISQCAQQWANNIAARNCMQHRPNNKYGENIYASFGKESVTGQEVVQSWYNEIKYYRFGQSQPSNFSQVGHFTQVVWKASTKVGVGIAKNGRNIYVVCNYDPPGNFGGRYPANVTAS